MFWGCMVAKGVGSFCRIEGWMDAPLYLSILQDDLMSTISKQNLNIKKIFFQHDNDPKHKSRLVKEWLDKTAIRVLDWPPYSPDLNPMENLFGVLKQRLATYPAGVEELWERIQKECAKIPTSLCSRLIESMPERVRAVIKARGGPTLF
eukprot:c10140_g1_i3.p1 GENE.c10140_g1_i3~~c10140_g1_i3.p1  ORF type:complete len:149 (+),score=31.70 c10140_g1_i3:438-884(+)